MSAKILTFPRKITDPWTEQREILAREIEATRPEIAQAIRRADKC